MFGNIMAMSDNYARRKVGRFDDGNKMVSTAAVTDGSCPFETAFQHPDYNNGEMVIVDAYDTREEAEAGHEKWVSIMENGPLQDELVEVCNSEISKFCGRVAGVYPRYKKKVD